MLSTNNKNDVPLIVVMGVAGSGKSTIAAGLAEKLGVDFIEGDGLHPQANINKMASGLPLTDDDRWPWLEAIGERIDAERVAGMGVVVSCSALRQVYRECLRKKVNGRVQFILLDSQLATLEKPGPGEDAVILDISHNVPTLLVEAVQSVGR